MGTGLDKMASFAMALEAAESPGEGDGGHPGVAKLTECRLGAAGSRFPPRRVSLTENGVGAGEPGASEVPVSDDPGTQAFLNPVCLGLLSHMSQ